MRIAVFMPDHDSAEELYGIDEMRHFALLEGCTHFYYQKRLYRIDVGRDVPVCDHNNVGEYFQDVIVERRSA